MKQYRELKYLLTASIAYLFVILLIVFVGAILGTGNPAAPLAAAAGSREKVEELIQLQAIGVPADLVLMLMSYGCADDAEALERQTVSYALDFMILHETVLEFECTGHASPPAEDGTPTPPADCDCEYEEVEQSSYPGKASILGYLGLAEGNPMLTVSNLEDTLNARAQALCDESDADDKREVFLAVVAPSAYPGIVRRYVPKELDAKAIMELHEAAYFIEWLSQEAERYGIAGNLQFLGKYPMPTSGNITSPFGWRMHPITMKKSFHTGIDIGSVKHTNIYSVADGVVVQVGTSPYDGQFVLVEHSGEAIPFYSYYGHLSLQSVRVGEAIQQGESVGLEGGDPEDPSPGYSTGHHLHFEIRMSRDGDQVNPLSFLKGGSEEDEETD